jgi:hypothetical protein
LRGQGHCNLCHLSELRLSSRSEKQPFPNRKPLLLLLLLLQLQLLPRLQLQLLQLLLLL